MYKIIFIMLFNLVSMVYCDPTSDATYNSRWYIHNNTENNITFSTLDITLTPFEKKTTIIPGDSSLFAVFDPRIDQGPDQFDLICRYWVRRIREEYPEKMYIKFQLDKENTDTALLPRIVWRHNEKDNGGKQFFNRANWQYRTKGKGQLLVVSYSFNVYPEDFGIEP